VTQRVFAQVTRGMTDKTAVCVYPWEVRLLEAVHGQGVEVVSIDQMCDMGKTVRVENVKLNHTDHQAPSLRQQLIDMACVDPDSDPARDPESEYGRMAEKYGMDKEVPLPVVTRLYGESSPGGAWEKEVRRLAKEKPHGDIRRSEFPDREREAA